MIASESSVPEQRAKLTMLRGEEGQQRVPVEKTASSPDFRLGHAGPLAISVWSGPPTMGHVEQALSLVSKVGKRHEGVLLLAVLAEGCPLPDDVVRNRLASGLSAAAEGIRAVANVVEGEGFRSAALRGALTSMALVLRPPYPQRATATVAQAASFLQGHSAGALQAADIIRAVDSLRGEEKPWR